MALSNRGTILPVTIVSMTVMMIIGIICLQMFSAQNILDTYDQVKLRTFYSAESTIEMMRGYIDYITNIKMQSNGDSWNNSRGFLNYKTISGAWAPLCITEADSYPVLESGFFDGTMYPGVKVSVSCSRLHSTEISNLHSNGIVNFNVSIPGESFYVADFVADDNSNDGNLCAYKIVAIASSTHKTSLSTQLIVSTVTYFFITKKFGTGNPGEDNIEHRKYFVCWRKD